MRRRTKIVTVGDTGVPDRLFTYNARDWPIACHPECGFYDAWMRWRDEHPDGCAVELDRSTWPADTPFHPESI